MISRPSLPRAPPAPRNGSGRSRMWGGPGSRSRSAPPSMSLGKIDSRAFCRLMKRTTLLPTHVKMVESVWKVFVFAKRGVRVVSPWLTTSPTALSERTRTGDRHRTCRHAAVPGLGTWSFPRGDGRTSCLLKTTPGKISPAARKDSKFRRDSMKRSVGHWQVKDCRQQRDGREGRTPRFCRLMNPHAQQGTGSGGHIATRIRTALKRKPSHLPLSWACSTGAWKGTWAWMMAIAIFRGEVACYCVLPVKRFFLFCAGCWVLSEVFSLAATSPSHVAWHGLMESLDFQSSCGNPPVERGELGRREPLKNPWAWLERGGLSVCLPAVTTGWMEDLMGWNFLSPSFPSPGAGFGSPG